jgi:hypothetical protein
MWNFFIKYKIKYKNEIVNLQNRRFFHKLGFYYEKTDYNQMKKYYLMAIELGDNKSMNNIIFYFKNSNSNIFEYYDTLLGIKNKSIIVNKEINEIELSRDILYYNNKIRLFEKLNNISTCPICLHDNILLIDMKCGHEICVNCYKYTTTCYFKWCT